jgi:hypothetical protein
MIDNSRHTLLRSADDIAGKFLMLTMNDFYLEELSKHVVPSPVPAIGNLTIAKTQHLVIMAHSEYQVSQTFVSASRFDEHNKGQFMTIADFSEAPGIEVCDLSRYDGKPGCTLNIRTCPELQVIEVLVRICNVDGSVSESGIALAGEDLNEWRYNTTKMIRFSHGRTIFIDVTCANTFQKPEQNNP